MSKDYTKVYCGMITACQQNESKLNEWEQGFVQSLSEQLDNGRTLSKKQIEILERINEKAIAK